MNPIAVQPQQNRPPPTHEQIEIIVNNVLDALNYLDPCWIRAQALLGRNQYFIINEVLDGRLQPKIKNSHNERIIDVSINQQSDTFSETFSANRSVLKRSDEMESLRRVLYDHVQQMKREYLIGNSIAITNNKLDFLKENFRMVRVSVLRHLFSTFPVELALTLAALYDTYPAYSSYPDDIIHLKQEGTDALIEKRLNLLRGVLHDGPMSSQRHNARTGNKSFVDNVAKKNFSGYKELQETLDAVKLLLSKSTRVDCGVCYENVLLMNTVTCQPFEDKSENEHTFCKDCVKGFAQASITENSIAYSGVGLKCMHPNCDRILLLAHVEKHIDKLTRTRLQRRVDEEVLRSAGVESESCKYCSFKIIMEDSPDSNKVFNCQKCNAQFCRLCHMDWVPHCGRRCDEMADAAISSLEEKIRKQIEEELVKVTVRACTKCGMPFDKIEGCNKMTCRCGELQCYLCRAKIQGYNHFCPHVRDPSQPDICPANCPLKCLLWVNPAERDAAERKKIIESFRGKVSDEILNKLL